MRAALSGRSGEHGVESSGMAASPIEPELERALLRRGVVALAEGRDGCAACGRTPLVGERVHSYADGRTLCELCRGTVREAPLASALVHGSERGHAVRARPIRRAA